MYLCYATTVFLYLLDLTYGNLGIKEGNADPEDSVLFKTSARNLADLSHSPLVTGALEEIELSLLTVEEKKNKERRIDLNENIEMYDKIIEKLLDLNTLCKVTEYTHAFFNAQGLQRLVIPNLDSPVPILRRNLLILLKTLFLSAPITAKSISAPKILEKMLRIFENDANNGNKATVIEVFRIWLPNNPEAQRRFVSHRGLERFHRQVTKLNGPVISNMLELFNLILEEHIDVYNMAENTQDDRKKKKTYQMVGFLDKMATQEVCQGLLQTLQFYWSIRQSDDSITHILYLLRNIKYFCLTAENSAESAVLFIDNLLSYFTADKNFTSAIDVRNVRLILEDYSTHLKVKARDEF